LLLATLLAAGLGPVEASAETASPATGPRLILILDASGSMWGQVDGENKIVIARRALGDLLQKLPDQAQVGLLAYGHRREGDCQDVELIHPLGPLDRSALNTKIEALNPKGKTPITRALEQAFEVAGKNPGKTTVVLVSDGLETCDGDPCAVARTAGADLVLHVVGFGVEESDVSQLECTAQYGGGLYFSAADAADLTDAFRQVVEEPPLPDNRLEIRATANGELVDALVKVIDTTNGETVASGRTYTQSDTNPRVLPLPPGIYDVEVSVVQLKSAPAYVIEDLRISGGTVRRDVDFSSGALAIRVTRNGQLSDAAIQIFPSGETRPAAGGRTYTRNDSNPKIFELPPGTYDVEILSRELASRPTARLEGIQVGGSARVERAHEFRSGLLAVKVTAGEELVDAILQIRGTGGGRPVASGRTYQSADTNPRLFDLEPGQYRIEVRPIDSDRFAQRDLTVTVTQGETIRAEAELGRR
jgi:Ca-activated chloride channel family protein